MTTRDWEQLARAIRTARRSHGWTQGGLAAAAKVGLSTVQRLESGRGYSRWPLGLDRVERSLEWSPGSVDAVLAGGEPTSSAAPAEQPSGPAQPVADPIDALPRRIRHELSKGEYLDHTVMDFPRSGGKLIVIATRDPERSPEDEAELGEEVAEWTRVQRGLHGLVKHDNEQDRED